MRLFRQTSWGDWNGVFRRIEQELRQKMCDRDSRIPAEIAPAELLDRITILEIERGRVNDGEKRETVRAELGSLLATQARGVKSSPELERLTARLRALNEALGRIEDDLRRHEQRHDFGAPFVELARSLIRTSDERAAIKRQIDRLIGSAAHGGDSYAWEPAAVAAGAA
jgi:hypothetical protein